MHTRVLQDRDQQGVGVGEIGIDVDSIPKEGAATKVDLGNDF